MELKQLRYFVAVAEELNFGRAAARLHISQPPLTRQIHRLEEELGVGLFHRTTRKVELTEAGRTFVLEARQIIARVAHAAGLATQANRGIAGHLVIGYTPPRTTLVAKTLKVFAQKYPNIRLELRDILGQTTELIRDGRVDVAFVPLPIESTGLVVHTVLREQFMIAMASAHRFAEKKTITVKELADEPNLLYPRRMNPVGYDQIVSLCQKCNLTMNIILEVEDLHTRLALVGAGFGVCVVRGSAIAFHSRDIVLRPLRNSPTVEIGIAYSRENRSQAVPLLVETAKFALRTGT